MKHIYNERYHESYDEVVLDNGLHVILWHKPNYEKSMFMMMTPFGAMGLTQIQGKEMIKHPSGIAHFLEHKMFAMDGDEDVMGQFSKMGANVNAFTSYRETAYFASTCNDPKEPLKLLLDFVQELNIDQASVEKEKGIILSELHMYKEMSDQRLLMETYTSLFHKHPMRLDIAGEDDDVSATTVEQLYQCYEMNYHPSNMILICISGYDSKELLELIEENQKQKQFAPWKPCETVKEAEPQSVVRSDFSFTMEVSEPKLCVAYKLKGIEDSYERLKQEWTIRLLLDANFSSLNPNYQSWLDQKIINDFCGYDIEFGEDYGILMFYSETSKPDEFIALCDHCVDEMKQGNISDAVLNQLKRRYFAQGVRSMNDFHDIATGFCRSYFMGIDYFKTFEIVEEICEQDIMEAGKRLNKEHRVLTRLMPET